MNPGASLGGVEAEAGLGVGVVGDFSAAVGVDCGVGFASGDHLHAACGQQRAQADAQGEREGLFRLAAEVAAEVVAAVSGV